MRDHLFFGFFALFFFAVSLFGWSLDFRWGNRATGPIMPNWVGRMMFALFGVAFLLVAIFSK
jgi:hypothetical protein